MEFLSFFKVVVFDEYHIMAFVYCLGDFNVEKHIEAEGSNAHKVSNRVLVGFALMVIGHGILLI